jgi:hypothetical protein
LRGATPYTHRVNSQKENIHKIHLETTTTKKKNTKESNRKVGKRSKSGKNVNNLSRGIHNECSGTQNI